jgi:hypothetical protein
LLYFPPTEPGQGTVWPGWWGSACGVGLQQVKAKAQALDPLLLVLDTLDAEMKYLEDIVEELDRGSRALALQVGLPDPIFLERQPARLLRNWWPPQDEGSRQPARLLRNWWSSQDGTSRQPARFLRNWWPSQDERSRQPVRLLRNWWLSQDERSWLYPTPAKTVVQPPNDVSPLPEFLSGNAWERQQQISASGCAMGLCFALAGVTFLFEVALGSNELERVLKVHLPNVHHGDLILSECCQGRGMEKNGSLLDVRSRGERRI